MTEYFRRHLDDQPVHRRWMDPRIFSLRADDVRSYLLGKEWILVPSDRPGVLVFQEPIIGPEGLLYQWVPINEKARDYSQHVYELLAAIAETEDRCVGDVLSDILRQRATAGPNGPGVALKNGVSPGRDAS